jgi:copper chaperone CopZ
MAKSKIELSVQGMTGDGVVRNIEANLSGVNGVEYVHVNLGAAKITVDYDDSVTNAEQLIGTVERLGFNAVQL